MRSHCTLPHRLRRARRFREEPSGDRPTHERGSNPGYLACSSIDGPTKLEMDLDTTLVRYFRTVDLEKVGAENLTSVIECCKVALGLEQDRGTRFALEAMLYLTVSSHDFEVDREDMLIGWQTQTS